MEPADPPQKKGSGRFHALAFVLSLWRWAKDSEDGTSQVAVFGPALALSRSGIVEKVAVGGVGRWLHEEENADRCSFCLSASDSFWKSQAEEPN